MAAGARPSASLLLASMALAGEQDMQSANAQRNFLVCFINGVAAILFIFTGSVNWTVAAVVMAGSITGGYFYACVAKRIPNSFCASSLPRRGRSSPSIISQRPIADV